MSRVRYDHGFAWDVFISYAWADNQTTESWVESFEARLAKRLDESSGRVTRIWRDARRIGPGTVLTPAVSEAVQDSAVFGWCCRRAGMPRSGARTSTGSSLIPDTGGPLRTARV